MTLASLLNALYHDILSLTLCLNNMSSSISANFKVFEFNQ